MPELSGAETIVAWQWLYGKLSTASAGVEVYPGQAPRGAAMPYILAQSWPRPGGGDVSAAGNVRVLAKLRFLVKVISATLEQAKPIVQAIDVAVRQDPSQPPPQQDGYSIQNIRRIEPYELPTVEGDDMYWQSGGYYDLDVTSGA